MNDSPQPDAPDDLAGHLLTGGKRSRFLFSRLFGLLGCKAWFRVVAVRWREERFEIDLRIRRAGGISLLLEGRAAGSGRRYLASSDGLGVWYQTYEGADSDGPIRSLGEQLKKAARRWKDLTAGRVFAAFIKDPELETTPLGGLAGAPGGQDDQDEQEGDDPLQERPTETVGLWNLPEAFADFLGEDAYAVSPFESIEVSNPFIRVSHSDIECLSFTPPETPSNQNYVELPWIKPSADGQALREQETGLCTGLNDNAVIMGCTPRASEVLEQIRASGDMRPIIFEHTCLPATTSEDVVSMIRRFAESHDAPLIYHDKGSDGPQDEMLTALLVDRRLAAEAKLQRRDDRLVNLVGFDDDESLGEIQGLLEGLGLKLNVALLPLLGEENIDRFPGAGATIYHRIAPRWERFYEQLQEGSDQRAVFLEGPYGVQGTRRWLEGIVAELGIEVDLEALWQRSFAPLEARWEGLVQRASRHPLGLVLRRRDLRYVLDPQLSQGIPLVRLLDECGFSLRFLLLDSGQGSDALRQGVEPLLEDPARHEFASFEDLDSLREQLRASPAESFYSNYCFDWRLAEAGKGRFSLRHFHLGIRGAMETVEGILRSCRSPFFREYGRYLTRTPQGLPPPRSRPLLARPAHRTRPRGA